MMNDLFLKISRMAPPILFILSAFISILLSILFVFGMSLFFFGNLHSDYLILGILAGFLVSFPINFIFIQFLKKIKYDEMKFVELIDNSPDGILIHNGKEVVFTNRKMLSILHQENRTKKTEPEEITNFFRKYLNQTEKNPNDSEPDEYKITCLDGKEIEVEIRTNRIYFRNENCTQYIIRDISEKKIKEKGLAFQYKISDILYRAKDRKDAIREILNALFHLSNWKTGSFWELNLKTNRLEWFSSHNFAGSQFPVFQTQTENFSFRKGDGLIGLVWKYQKPVWVDDLRNYKDFLRLATALDDNLKSAFAFPVKYNEEFYGVMECFSDHIKPLNRDIIDMFQSVSQEIGRFFHHKKEEAVVYKLNQAIHSSPVAMMLTSIEGDIDYINPQFTDLTGFQNEDVLGKNPRIFKSGFTGHSEYKEFWDKILSGKKWSGLWYNRRRTEEIYLEKETVAPIFDKNGDLTNFVATKEDFTNQLKLREAILEAKEIAEKANRAKSDFLACMSHEIRNPLTTLIGMISLLEGTPLNAKQQKFLNIAETSGNHLMQLINNILDFSKIEAGKIELENTEFHLREVVSNAIELLYYSADQKGLILGYSISPGVEPFLKGDSFRLTQILLNLIGNAIKFTQTGSVRLEIRKDSEIENKTRLIFDVIDTGIGISDENLSKLFIPFSQTESSISKNYGGTGLGLSITKNLIELMNGTISVKHNENGGTIFSFTAEFEIQSAISNSGVSTLDNKIDFGTNNRMGHKILVAEDDSLNKLVIQEVLSELGYYSDIVSTGKELLELLVKNEYSMVLMDLTLPEMDGFEVARMIRDKTFTGYNHTIPIVAFTGSALREDREKCFKAGMNDILLKPYRLNDLENMLNKWIRIGS